MDYNPRCLQAVLGKLCAQQFGRIFTSPNAEEASAYVDQAEDYFRAAILAETSATRPVLFYYTFLNIAKAFIVLRTGVASLPREARAFRTAAM